ncbi:hypothetical protein VTK26DRAFT_1334 [Humicola hyalothermophila]
MRRRSQRGGGQQRRLDVSLWNWSTRVSNHHGNSLRNSLRNSHLAGCRVSVTARSVIFLKAPTVPRQIRKPPNRSTLLSLLGRCRPTWKFGPCSLGEQSTGPLSGPASSQMSLSDLTPRSKLSQTVKTSSPRPPRAPRRGSIFNSSPAAPDRKTRNSRTYTNQPSLNFLAVHGWSLAILILALAIQFFLRRTDLDHLSSLKTRYSPLLPSASHSPTAGRRHDLATCENPVPFPGSAPTSKPLTMSLEAETKSIVAQFEYTDEDVNKGVKEFLRQMQVGLEKDGTSLSQIPTYVTGVPNGKEKGLYMAVDLGGTNLRVCSIELNGDSTYKPPAMSKVELPKARMVGTAQELFSFLAQEVKAFLQKHHKDQLEQHLSPQNTVSSPDGYRDKRVFRMGFTFSFPVQQVGINKGTLIRWTKGFNIPDAVGKDVCALLQEELDKSDLPVKVAALVNDTVGTLLARSYTAKRKHGSILGAIFGTGTNGAYVEKLSNIKKPLQGEYKSTGEMVVNTEWGSFDNQLNVLPTTPWDKALDESTVNPGVQMYEKRVSGMFLGEILRRIIVDLLENHKVSPFKDENSASNDWRSTTTIDKSSSLYKQWGLDTKIMSDAAKDSTSTLSDLREKLKESLQIDSPAIDGAHQFDIAHAFKQISAAVGRRAARLSAVAIAAIVLQSGKLTDPDFPKDELVDVGVDGSLVEHYPNFRKMIYEALCVVDGIGKEGASRIRIELARDGSGVGAALAALVAARMETEEAATTTTAAAGSS